ncbi:MAG: NAD(P)/FAD-dependent oxidoreductase [Candidatus Nanopelagicales bacterium]
MSKINSDVLIIGAGPAGLYAAYYAGYRGMSVTVMDSLDEVGGQISAMYPEKLIFDVAGHPGVKGRDLVNNLATQAGAFNPTYVLGHQAEELVQTDDELIVQSHKGQQIAAKAIIITGGIGTFKPRALPAGEEFLGKGLVYFVPDFQQHAGKDIVIVGGGDSAFDWALNLHPIAKSITLVHRREEFRAHATTVEQVKKLGVKIITSSEVSAINGDDWITEVKVTHKVTKEETTMPAQTVIAALGFVANLGPFTKWGLDVLGRKIAVNTKMQTNLDRIYAAGDITTYEGKVPLIAVGFGESATAVNNAYVAINPDAHLNPPHSSGDAE